MDDPEFEELTEKTRKDCYEKVKLINEKIPTCFWCVLYFLMLRSKGNQFNFK